MVVAAGISVADGDSPAMREIARIQDLVGSWHGSGKSDKSKGWDEAVECAWKFKRDGKCGLYLKLKDGKAKSVGRVFDEMSIVYNADAKCFVLKANVAGDDAAPTLQFHGKLASPTNIVFDRVDKGDAADAFDRLDFKLLNEGDRLVYSVARRIGQTKRYRQYAQVAFDREGASLAAAANKPKCVVTGGAATMSVSYNGQSYPVCCTGCREMFLENPEKFIAKGRPKS